MKSINRVLVVDDEIVILELMSHFLKAEVNIIDTAVNGEVALDKINSNDYDLIISDISMPKMDGIALLKEIRKINNTTPFIFFSAYENLKEEIERFDLDVLMFLVKPIKKQKISQMLEEFNKKKAS